MQQVKELVEKGETLKALKRLQTLVDDDNKDSVIALLGRFHTHQKEVIKDTLDPNNKTINQINDAILIICKEYKSIDKPKTFAEPPILDNLPLDKEGYLLGRKAALADLHTTLQGNGIMTLVNGMGGIGKSTLAAFYANMPQYKAAYSHCFWVAVSDITGEIEEAMISAFAEALELYKMTTRKQLQKIETYLSGLQGQTLLILDNANDDKKVKNSLIFLRKCKCKVLFTTRANVQNLQSLPLAKLLPEDAFMLFTHYFPAATELPETAQLLQNIDYHTLLTEFMAKSLQHNPALSLQDLIAITQQQSFTDELLTYTQFTTYHTHTHNNPDAAIQPAKYLLQIFPIQNLSEKEQEILRYFSILPTTWIEKEMWLQLFIKQPLKLENNQKGCLGAIGRFFVKIYKSFEPNKKQEELKLGIILQSLYEKGWLQKSPTNTFACHILLQHILRQQLQPNAKNCELLLQNLKDATWSDVYTNNLTLAPYLPLIATVLDWIKEDTQLIASIYNSSATIYEAIGNYMQALSYNLENVRITEKVLADNDADLATAYNNIASTYEYLGDYQKSLVYGLKALAIQEKVLSSEHLNLAKSYNDIAITYKKLGDYQKSLEYGLKAIAICEKVLSPEHPNLATSYSNIALTYQELEDYQKSLEYGLKALAIKEKVLSPEHPSLAISYNNIAWTYYYLKDYATAYTYIQKAITIRIKVLPKGHPHIKDSLDIKATIEKAMRKK